MTVKEPRESLRDVPGGCDYSTRNRQMSLFDFN